MYDAFLRELEAIKTAALSASTILPKAMGGRVPTIARMPGQLSQHTKLTMLAGKSPMPASGKMLAVGNDLHYGENSIPQAVQSGPAALADTVPPPRRLKVAQPNVSMLRRIGENLVRHEDAHEIAGLGTLAIPSLDYAQARLRSAAAGDKSPDAVKKRRIMGSDAAEAAEVGGLGYLAAPLVAKTIMRRKGIPLPGAH